MKKIKSNNNKLVEKIKFSRITKLKFFSYIFLSISLILCSIIDFLDYHPFREEIENRLLEEAKLRISLIRKGTILLDFGIGNASKYVYIHQINHHFKFGSNFFQYNYFPTNDLNEKYEQLFCALFNYATIPFYWSVYEPQENNYAYLERLHNMTSFLISNNISIKGHPIVWQYNNTIPDWLLNKTLIAQQNKTLEHIQHVLSNFTEIKIWDLLNEPLHVNNSWLGRNQYETWIAALEKARSLRNDTQFIINEYNILDTSSINNYFIESDIDKYYNLIKSIKNNGYSPDAIGFQFHSTDKWVSTSHIINTLDKFADFKIPLHITEFIPGSKGFYQGGIKRGKITPETQAEYAEKIYTILFSHPAVYAITWWDFATNARWRAWKEDLGGYMMDSLGNILPVYDRLYELIHQEWNSTCYTKLDENGRLEFTGFYGDYYISIYDGPTIYFSIVDNRTTEEKPWKISDVEQLFI